MKQKAKELREKKPEELSLLERDLRKELSLMQLKVRLGTEAHTSRLREIRRSVARILTLRKEKGMGQAQ
jgi:ribosomal protein L29